MKVGDKVTLATPWYDTPCEGTIVGVFDTPGGNYYIVKFNDGTKCGYKESDIDKPSPAMMILLGSLGRGETKDFCIGYIAALYVQNIIDRKEYNKYLNLFEKEKRHESDQKP